MKDRKTLYSLLILVAVVIWILCHGKGKKMDLFLWAKYNKEGQGLQPFDLLCFLDKLAAPTSIFPGPHFNPPLRYYFLLRFWEWCYLIWLHSCGFYLCFCTYFHNQKHTPKKKKNQSLLILARNTNSSQKHKKGLVWIPILFKYIWDFSTQNSVSSSSHCYI